MSSFANRGGERIAARLLADASRELPDPFTPYGYWFNVAASRAS